MIRNTRLVAVGIVSAVLLLSLAWLFGSAKMQSGVDSSTHAVDHQDYDPPAQENGLEAGPRRPHQGVKEDASTDHLRVIVTAASEPVTGAKVRITGTPSGLVGTTNKNGFADFSRTDLMSRSPIMWVEASSPEGCVGRRFDSRRPLVRLDMARSEFTWTKGRVVRGQTQSGLRGAVVRSGIQTAATDESGNFGIWLPTGSFCLLEVFIDEQYAAEHYAEPGRFARIRVESRERLTIAVSGGQAGESVSVRLFQYDDETGRDLAKRTGSAGDTFIFDTLPAGSMTLQVDAEGYSRHVQEIFSEDAHVTVELRVDNPFVVWFPAASDHNMSAVYSSSHSRSSVTANAERKGVLEISQNADWSHLQLISSASVGSGRGPIWGHTIVDSSTRELDLSELRLHSCDFAVLDSEGTPRPGILFLNFHNDSAPIHPTVWLGHGTRFGAMNFDCRTDASGNLRLLLPECRITVAGRLAGGGALGEVVLEVSADSKLTILSEHASDEGSHLRLEREGDALPGRRVELRQVGVVGVFSGVSDEDGLVNFNGLADGFYQCAVEATRGLIGGAEFEVKMRQGQTAHVQIPPSGVLTVMPSSGANPLTVIYAKPKGASRLLPDGRGNVARFVVFERYLRDGFEVSLPDGTYFVRSKVGGRSSMHDVVEIRNSGHVSLILP